ncbi:MAG: crossover junction endodeoxyribonuclease RuvC [Candidatus Paceibacterota bacterium]
MLVRSTKILGIDPGYDRLGLAIVEKGSSDLKLIYSACLQTSKKDDLSLRFLFLGQKLKDIIKKEKPDSVALETLYFSVNQKTASKVAEVRGMITYICASLGLPIFEYNPMQIKVCVAGWGGAGKKQIIELVKKQIIVPNTVKIDDEYDAIAIALTHLAMSKTLKY